MENRKEVPKETLEMLESLRKAVANALEKKKRLGQYAVVWGDDGVEVIGDEFNYNDRNETWDEEN